MNNAVSFNWKGERGMTFTERMVLELEKQGKSRLGPCQGMASAKYTGLTKTN